MNNDDCYVLFVDHQGHPAPLSLCYHATASRQLASSVDRRPPSTLTEVDSAYCPQCLTFYDSSTAGTIGFCPKASCRLCPLCQSVTSVSFSTEGQPESFYKCGLCSWTSKECQLTAAITIESDGSVKPENLELGAEELGSHLQERIGQGNQSASDHYKIMLSTLEGMAKDQIKGQRTTFFLPAAIIPKRSLENQEGWSIKSLEESLVARKQLVRQSISQTLGDQDLQLVSLMAESSLHESMDGKPVDSLLTQMDARATTRSNDLLPLPVPLRPRKSRRCRSELAEGRPGILLKPKLNPLEGDSSLRTGHGQWWKKDSSAIQVLPRVKVSMHKSDGRRHIFLIRVTNPTLGSIRLRLAESKYEGETKWGCPEETSHSLQNVMVDSLQDLSVDIQLSKEATNGISETEICQLEPAEDSFLELGKSAMEEPESVTKWNPADSLAASKVSLGGETSSLRLVGASNSSAWFELVVLEQTTEPGIHSAVTLALQIEVGNGSWESSLIAAKNPESEEPDLVTFDVVVAYSYKRPE